MDADFPFSKRASRPTPGLAKKILLIDASKLRSSCLFRFLLYRLLGRLLSNPLLLHLWLFFLLLRQLVSGFL
jgi:hypothetical protein